MRICLIPLKTKPRDPEGNMRQLRIRMTEAAQHHPDLVCLPECSLTGYLYEEADFQRFAEPLDGATMQVMSELARAYKVHLCYGFLEKAKVSVHNTAILLDGDGHLAHVHRKFSEKPPFINGDQACSVETKIGWLGILICGDLFAEDLPDRIDRRTQLLLVPMSRSFDGNSPNVERWQCEERQAYLEAVKRLALPAVIVNALDDAAGDISFGGALAVGSGGKLLAESPHGSDTLLVWDFDLCH